MENYYLRNLHAEFYKDQGDPFIKVYFESHMNDSWELVDIQVPPQNTVIASDLVLKFKTDETKSKGTYGVVGYTKVYPVNIPANYRHFTTVVIFHSRGSDKDSMETVGDPN